MLTFEDISNPSHVPANLLPAGVPELLAPPAAGQPVVTRLLYQQVNAAGTGAFAVDHLAEPLATLMAEDRLAQAIVDMGGDPSEPSFLAGRGAAAASGSSALAQALPPSRTGQADQGVAEMAVLDAGIAFWNPAFTDPNGQSRFATFSGLRLQAGQVVGPQVLTAQQLSDMVARGHSIPGDRENRRQLAILMPSSVYAPGPKGRDLFPPDEMAHGTAMSEMILSTAPADARLHGMELPQDVVRDLTGGLMTGVLVPAVRALIDQVIAARSDTKPFRMVMLVAFGFLGGPQEGMGVPAPLVSALSALLASYRNIGVDVEMVVPMGNHLQDQAHARLTAGRSVGWRIQPDDHSANTLELIYQGRPARLRLTAPDGSKLKLRRKRAALGRILYQGRAIGAVWDEPLGRGMWRTRISLTPSATRNTGLSHAPFGRWQVKLRKGRAVQTWVLRDEVGFDPDPSAPSRRSWLEDGVRPLRDPLGYPFLNDNAAPAGALVLRDGSASLLATHQQAQITSVGAQWSAKPDPTTAQSWYSGNALNGMPPDQWADLSYGAQSEYRSIGPFGRRAVLGNGSPRRYRAAGTSLAAALVAGQRA